MSADEEMIAILTQVQNFLFQNILTKKCILIIGPIGSGKSTLINFFCGTGYTRQDNQQGIPFLVQNPNIAPQQQPTVYKHGKIPFQLTICTSIHPNDGQQLTIIQMPSFVSIKTQNQQQSSQDASQLFNRVFFTLFVWKTIGNLTKQVHITLIFPYQFVTDQHKLIQFLSTWEKIIISNPQVKQNLRKCVSIIFTKPQYEDDKQGLIGSLSNLTQMGNQDINQNNTFSNATEENRIYCFLSQDTQQGKGQQLLNQMLTNVVFYEKKILSPDWGQTAIWSIIKQESDDKMKGFMELIQIFFKKFINSEQICSKPFNKSLPLLGIAASVYFLNLLPKPNPLKQKQSQLENQIKNILKQQPIISMQTITNLQKNKKKEPSLYLKFLLQINNLIQKGMKLQMLISQLNQKIQKQFWQIFSVDQNQKNTIINWLDQRTILWKLLDVFQKVCQKHKQNVQLQHHIQSLEDLAKDSVKKYAGLIKGKLTSLLKQYQIFNKLNQIKNISQQPQFKQLFPIFGGGGEEDEIIEQQQEAVTNSDPRISRLYYKTEQISDLFAQVKQKAKKIVIKLTPKSQQINQRQFIKNLLGAIQRQPEKRVQNLELLANKLAQFNFYQLALEMYMDLGNPFILQKFINKNYFNYVQRKQNYALYEFIQNQLIPYLEQKATIYQDLQKANKFYQIAQSCYDFISVNFAQNAEQFADLIMLSNQIGKPNQNQVLQLDEIEQMSPTSSNGSINKNVEIGRFSLLDKAEIIQSINSRDIRNKKNLALHTQIKKYMEVANQALKIK